MGLLQEQIVSTLEKGYLIGAHCSACIKVIVNKTKLIEQELATKTMFNMKWLLLTYDNYSAAKDTYFFFCISHQCFIDVSINNTNDNNEGARRSSSRK